MFVSVLKCMIGLPLKSCRCHFGRQMSKLVLGIETSCDETGAAVVDEKGRVHGEALRSQMNIHLEYGGVIPHIAAHMHYQHIEHVVSSAIQNSGFCNEEISAFAVTTKPGLKASLLVGLDYTKSLAKQFNKPLIPIHHMEAHSLTIRMVESVEYPFVVLLASGGHCQIAIVKDVSEFYLLGTSQNNTPGELLDKIARRLKLQNLPECSEMSGGQAIEYMAKSGDPYSFKVPHSLVAFRDCNFSFSGYGAYAMVEIEREEIKYDVAADGVIPSVRDFCASLQHAFAVHLVHRVQRALFYCNQIGMIPASNRTLVFSGGVARNEYIRNALKEICDTMDYRFLCPPPKLCTDNGIMIAWNGMEKFIRGIDVYEEFDHITVEPSCPLGVDYTQAVKEASIKIRMPKLGFRQKSSNELEKEITYNS